MPAEPHEPAAACWPANAWYVACMRDELGEAPLGRQICGERMVFYRGAHGVAALEDFCPHRGAPLSLGFVRDGALVCGYHGLTVQHDGRACGMPGQHVANFPQIRSFPAIERHGFIWVWPGVAERADVAAIPTLHWATSPGWVFGGGMYRVACDYRLMIDNLMDLTHENYVHAGSIGQKEIDEAPVTTQVDGDDVVTSRYMHNVSAPPFWRMGLRGAGLPEDAPVDRWQICHFAPPSNVMIDVGVALAGHGGFDAEHGSKAAAVVVDFMTPETATSHWYFWGMARSFAIDDAALTASIRDGQGRIFSEDLAMLEQQQRNVSQHPARRLLKLNIDAGGVHARLRINRAIAAEA